MSNPRVFDVHVPGEYESVWTVNLIEHLCRIEDERSRLREAIGHIRDNPNAGQEVRSIAEGSLAQCYHSWLVNSRISEGRMGRYFCPVCGQKGSDITEHFQ